MKLIEWFKAIPTLFDWYFKLTQIKRIQFNYIVIIAVLLTIFYYNDAKHRETNLALTTRVDSVNSNREKEQEKYTKKLEYYTDKFNGLLEMLIAKKTEQQIKKH